MTVLFRDHENRIRNLDILVLLGIALVAELAFSRFFAWGLYLDLPLIFTVLAGWRGTPVQGAAGGTLFGLLQDAVLRSLLGLNGLSKTVLGYASSYLNRWVFLEGLPVRALILALCSFLDRTLVFGMLALLGAQLRPGFFRESLIQAAVTGLGGALIFKLFDRIRARPKDFRRLDE